MGRGNEAGGKISGRWWLLRGSVAVARAAPVSAKPRYHFCFRSCLQSIKNKEIDFFKSSSISFSALLQSNPAPHKLHFHISTSSSMDQPDWPQGLHQNILKHCWKPTVASLHILDEYPTSWSWSTVPCGLELTFFQSSLAVLTLA